MGNTDKVIPNGKWEFDESVAGCFDDMLHRSIPGYENMRELVFAVGRNFVQPNTRIVDIGCSHGVAIQPFVNQYDEKNRYSLYDVSEPMLKLCRERYKTLLEHGVANIENHDLREGIPDKNVSLVLSVLTLQFTPIEYRHKILKSIYDSLNEDGALILVEKVLGNTAEIDDILVQEYYEKKAENAYTQEQIMTKRKSLEGVLVPITARWNEDLLRETGFKRIDCFWRYLNFAGWIAIK